jgi:streptogramin lyase
LLSISLKPCCLITELNLEGTKMLYERKSRNDSRPALAAATAAFLLIWMCGAAAADGCRTYTLDADFDEGVLVGVEHETVHDQLQLSQAPVILPFIWVPNEGQGTVSKINTETGDELGRYRVAPHSNCSPSRTTVDLQGNCWVGVRDAGTVVKIGLYEAGQWIDRNGDANCQTSQDINGDGDITGAELLPWGQDECVLYEVVLIPGSEGTYAPGTYPGPYDYGHWSTSPRGLAIDASNSLWAGAWISRTYYYIDGSTGAILNSVDVSPWSHSAYGAVIDGHGVLWSSGHGQNHVLRLDPSTNPPTISTLGIGHFVYGIGVDYLDHLFVSGWTDRRLSRVDILASVLQWTQYKSELDRARGLVCTSDNDVWVASTVNDCVYRYDNGGNWKATIYVGNGPTGVAVDAAGKVWSCNLNDEYITRINPVTNTVDLQKTIVGSGGHYSYSDMTGIIARTITTKLGTWTVTYDSGTADTLWGTISWNSDEPNGTVVTVEARSSNDATTWSASETASNGTDLVTTPNGRYLEVKVTLQIITGETSPILFDLTVCPGLIAVDIDIKPTSCPNPLNLRTRGVLPVAILGSGEFDVSNIDVASVRLAGVGAIRSSLEDVTGPVADGNECACTTAGPDGNMDLTLKFRTPEIAVALLNDVGELTEGEQLVLTLMGTLMDGTPIEGSDCVVLVGQVPESVAATRADSNKDGKVDLRDLVLLKRYFGKSAALED